MTQDQINQRIMMPDCRRCCRPAYHHGDHCALCLERARKGRTSR